MSRFPHAPTSLTLRPSAAPRARLRARRSTRLHRYRTDPGHAEGTPRAAHASADRPARVEPAEPQRDQIAPARRARRARAFDRLLAAQPRLPAGRRILALALRGSQPVRLDAYQLARNLGVPTLVSFMGGAMGAITDAPSSLLAQTNEVDNKAAPTVSNLSAVRTAAMMQSANTHSLSLNGTTDYLEVPNSPSINFRGYAVEKDVVQKGA
jgi:hypothetical protein